MQPRYSRSRCGSCGAPIFWVVVKQSKRPMPLDFEPHEQGNVVVDLETCFATVLKKDDQVRPGIMKYKSHFATCPNADSHRRKKNATEGTEGI